MKILFKLMRLVQRLVAYTLLPGYAWAGTTLYGVDNNGIYQINTTNSVSTTIYTGNPFPISDSGTLAGLAQCPNGLIYFIRRNGTGTLHSYNPATPSVSAVTIGNTGISGSPSTGIIRMTCDPVAGTLYAMSGVPSTLYTINKTTAAVATTAITLPGTTPPGNPSSGDIGFSPSGTLYYAGQTSGTTNRLWTINLGTNTMSNVGALTSALASSINGIGFSSTGTMYVSRSGETRLYTAPITGGALTAVGSSGAMPAALDLSSVEVPNPDLSVTKSDGLSVATPGDSLTYTIVATNNSTYAVTGSFTDTLPATLSSISWTCSASAGSSCSSASGSGSPISLSLILASAGTATITVNATLSSSASGNLTNTASIALPWSFLTDAASGNNSATDTDTIVLPSLIFLKTVAVTSDPVNGTSNPKFIPGADALYSLRVTNSGAGKVTNNSVIITDPIPSNTELFTGNLSGGAPFSFADGSPSSGLACGFSSLNNLSDCVDFSNDGGTTWSYVPNGSYDPAVTNIRFKPSGAMSGDPVAGSPSPYFDLGIRVRVK
jgi:uncharacterized repeat protein (TIGR01451 family)